VGIEVLDPPGAGGQHLIPDVVVVMMAGLKANPTSRTGSPSTTRPTGMP